jgi:hypothetical protein
VFSPLELDFVIYTEIARKNSQHKL